MTDVSITITVQDWGDVPLDEEQRREILREIAHHAERAARYYAEDEHGLATSGDVDVDQRYYC